MGEQEKRDSERMELLGLLHGEVMTFQPMAVRQISRGGMQVETRFALLLDSLHEFRLTLGERSIVIKGRIVHSHISDVDPEAVLYVTGVEFIEPSAHAQSVIDDFVELLRLTKFKMTAPRKPTRTNRRDRPLKPLS